MKWIKSQNKKNNTKYKLKISKRLKNLVANQQKCQLTCVFNIFKKKLKTVIVLACVLSFFRCYGNHGTNMNRLIILLLIRTPCLIKIVPSKRNLLTSFYTLHQGFDMFAGVLNAQSHPSIYRSHLLSVILFQLHQGHLCGCAIAYPKCTQK